MTNAELISKIKAEIERLKRNMDDRDPLAPNQKAGYLFALADLLSFLSTLESEKPINPADAMKALDEKIALVKQRGTWDGVDVDKYMDEVRGREPEKPVPNDLEEAAGDYASDGTGFIDMTAYRAFIAGAKWDRSQMMKEAVEGEVVKTDKHTSVRYKSYYGTDRYFYGIADKQFRPGDKVRIVIVKED